MQVKYVRNCAKTYWRNLVRGFARNLEKTETSRKKALGIMPRRNIEEIQVGTLITSKIKSRRNWGAKSRGEIYAKCRKTQWKTFMEELLPKSRKNLTRNYWKAIPENNQEKFLKELRIYPAKILVVYREGPWRKSWEVLQYKSQEHLSGIAKKSRTISERTIYAMDKPGKPGRA